MTEDERKRLLTPLSESELIDLINRCNDRIDDIDLVDQKNIKTREQADRLLRDVMVGHYSR